MINGITTWESQGMNWNDPEETFDSRYLQALNCALMERYYASCLGIPELLKIPVYDNEGILFTWARLDTINNAIKTLCQYYINHNFPADNPGNFSGYGYGSTLYALRSWYGYTALLRELGESEIVIGENIMNGPRLTAWARQRYRMINLLRWFYSNRLAWQAPDPDLSEYYYEIPARYEYQYDGETFYSTAAFRKKSYRAWGPTPTWEELMNKIDTVPWNDWTPGDEVLQHTGPMVFYSDDDGGLFPGSTAGTWYTNHSHLCYQVKNYFTKKTTPRFPFAMDVYGARDSTDYMLPQSHSELADNWGSMCLCGSLELDESEKEIKSFNDNFYDGSKFIEEDASLIIPGWSEFSGFVLLGYAGSHCVIKPEFKFQNWLEA